MASAPLFEFRPYFNGSLFDTHTTTPQSFMANIFTISWPLHFYPEKNIYTSMLKIISVLLVTFLFVLYFALSRDTWWVFFDSFTPPKMCPFESRCTFCSSNPLWSPTTHSPTHTWAAANFFCSSVHFTACHCSWCFLHCNISHHIHSLKYNITFGHVWGLKPILVSLGRQDQWTSPVNIRFPIQCQHQGTRTPPKSEYNNGCPGFFLEIFSAWSAASGLQTIVSVLKLPPLAERS